MLFVNQGIGGDTMGHTAVEASLRRGLGSADAIEPVFRHLGPWNLASRLAGHPVPLLHGADLDLYDVRGHLIEGLRGRRVIEASVRRDRPDALHVDSHCMALLAGDVLGRIPTYLSVDATVWAWRQLALDRPVRSHSKAALALPLALERHVLAGATGVLAQSHWAAESVRRAAPTARVQVLHPGIDADRYRPAAKERRRRPRVLFVGGRFREKGGAELLEALSPYVGTRLDLEVVTPSHVVPAPGVRVHRLAPGTPELVRLVQQADVFCLPTHRDALPMAMLEALACAVPVVSTTVAAIPEVIGETGAGRLVPPGDPAALRRAVLELVDDGPTRLAIGERAREVIEGRYDARRQGEALSRLLEGETGAATAAAV